MRWATEQLSARSETVGQRSWLWCRELPERIRSHYYSPDDAAVAREACGSVSWELAEA